MAADNILVLTRRAVVAGKSETSFRFAPATMVRFVDEEAVCFVAGIRLLAEELIDEEASELLDLDVLCKQVVRNMAIVGVLSEVGLGTMVDLNQWGLY